VSVTFFSVSLDCADAGKQASFWSQLLNRPVDDGGSQDFAAIGLQNGGVGGVVWMFHQVPEPKQAKNRLHVDFLAADLSEEVERVLTLGATHIQDVDEGGFRWSTLADPEGNEFDIVATPQ
jgi:predicted enzyme related to lactoylglutathione lyase